MKAKGLSPPPSGEIAGEEWVKWFEWLYFRVPRMQTYEVSIAPGTVSASSTKEVTATVKGLATDDIVLAQKPTHTSGIVLAGARVSAKDTLAVALGNVTGAGIAVPTETWLIATIRR